MPFPEKPDPDMCPKCGTTDCLSHEEYLKHVKITGAGCISVDSNIIYKTCRGRQQLNAARKLAKKLGLTR